MILYHYEKGDRPITVGGFWFDYGGIKRMDIPSYLAEMEYIPDWDKNFVCCCKELNQVLTYFPEDVHRKLNGVFNVYDYNDKNPIIMRRDSIMEYLTVNSKLMKLIETLSWEQAMLRTRGGSP
ncbi:MAG: hypothetical protein LBH43_21445 [Treponema sp.]|jgi:hypothetical protein|nr:hypothetical protein [Treponema sp.]